jgi:hypothetical protein
VKLGGVELSKHTLRLFLLLISRSCSVVSLSNLFLVFPFPVHTSMLDNFAYGVLVLYSSARYCFY